MASVPTDNDIKQRAEAVEATFRVQDGLYVIGSFERGVTVYSQQLRAHNLVWALWERHRDRGHRLGRVAIVGGGISGLTVAAAILARFEAPTSVTIFEQLWDLCPLQQGADSRWLHPRIYDWPATGSRAPEAGLPVINWSEARASDVSRVVLKEFSNYCAAFDRSGERLTVLLGLRHFRIHAADRRIDWIASKALRANAFFHVAASEGSSASFDIVILAAGFGLETVSEDYPTPSYWRNEQLGQPTFGDRPEYYVISGFGDGALIDLCRLTIERFRQDTILADLFPNNLDYVEEQLINGIKGLKKGDNIFSFLLSIEKDLLSKAQTELGKRIRKDTRVTLHISGRNDAVKSFQDIFLGKSSFLNRLLLFMLYRCGAFGLSLMSLKDTVRQFGSARHSVLCRYGANPLKHIGSMFVDFDKIEERLKQMDHDQKQEARPLWELGSFPHYSSVPPSP